MKQDVFKELDKQIADFEACLSQLSANNTALFSQEIEDENELLKKIITLLNSETFKRACAINDFGLLQKKLQNLQNMVIGSSLAELKELYKELQTIEAKQIMEEKDALDKIKKTMKNGSEFDDFSELFSGDLFMNYYMKRDKEKSKK